MTGEFVIPQPVQLRPELRSELSIDEAVIRNGKSVLDVSAEIRRLLSQLGASRVEAVAYDTAWIARLGEVESELASAALAWLRANQLSDGGWGAPMPLYHHDRVICTLAAIIALARHDAPEDQPRIVRALPALQHSLAGLSCDLAGKTVAFEMLLPSLVAEATALGLVIQDPEGIVDAMSRLRDAKLAHAPRGLIDRSTTLGFSTEMVGADGLHLLDQDNLLQNDGSVSGSPAATAFFAANVRADPAALQYLLRVIHQGGAPHVTSSDIFEPAWAVWNLTRGREVDPVVMSYCTSMLERLKTYWRPDRGIAHDSTYTVQDADDTGVVFELLAQFDQAPDLAAILYYEEDTHFRSFDLESHISISTNIHILGALRRAGLDVSDPTIQKIASFLRQEETEENFWVDKWHTSPYYPTCHAIMVCTAYLDDVIENAVAWVLATQNADGSWGYFLPTAEETAYCLQALMALHRQGIPVPRAAITRGAAWLQRNAAPPYPPMWIIKTLYCPIPIVQTAILGVLREVEIELGMLT